MHYVCREMEDQITLRVSRELYRALTRQARKQGVAKSRLVREAIETYLAATSGEEAPTATWDRLAPLIGSVCLDRSAIEQDALTRQISEHNLPG
ncbi:MAG: ribbon-helix-helix protein, CopG family [Gemmatimonadales bacterium]